MKNLRLSCEIGVFSNSEEILINNSHNNAFKAQLQLRKCAIFGPVLSIIEINKKELKLIKLSFITSIESSQCDVAIIKYKYKDVPYSFEIRVHGLYDEFSDFISKLDIAWKCTINKKKIPFSLPKNLTPEKTVSKASQNTATTTATSSSSSTKKQKKRPRISTGYTPANTLSPSRPRAKKLFSAANISGKSLSSYQMRNKINLSKFSNFKKLKRNEEYYTNSDSNWSRTSAPVIKSNRRFFGNTDKGITNMGNTCYLNAILQMLLSLVPFIKDLNSFYWKTLASKLNHKQADFYSSLLTVIDQYTMKRSIDPMPVKNAIGRLTKCFDNNKQQDAHEFLNNCLERLNVELLPFVETLQQIIDKENAVIDMTVSPTPIISSPEKTKLECIITPPFTKGTNNRIDLTKITPKKHTFSSSNLSSTLKVIENKALLESNKVDIKLLSLMPTYRNFHSSIEIKLQCNQCNHQRIKTEDFRDLSLNLPPEVDDVELNQLIKHYFQAEVVDLDCENCNHDKATLSYSISELPKILLLHINRFEADVERQTYSKKRNKVNASMTLSLDDYKTANVKFPNFKSLNVSSDKERTAHNIYQTCNYQLRGIVNHIGNDGFRGHYTTTIFDSSKDCWTLYNDSAVSTITEYDAIRSSSAQRKSYIYFYILN